MRRLLVLGVIIVSMLPGCLLRPKSLLKSVQNGELAYRVERSDGMTYFVQAPSLTSIRGVMNELRCEQGYGCTLGVVRLNISKNDDNPVQGPRRATIELVKDTQAGEILLPAGLYEIYSSNLSLKPKLFFAPITDVVSASSVIVVPCWLDHQSQPNVDNRIFALDINDSRAALRKIQIKGENISYMFGPRNR